MYRHCIYCSADLGSNDAVEEFPVGRTVAVDAAKGRLWAVCAKCARWNLAPIEERWEAVEAAEKLFADARLRVRSENIGLAKLRDGTKLVRIGPAEGRELAAWRYGTELRGRRRRHYLALAGSAALFAAVWRLEAIGVLSGGYLITQFGPWVANYFRARRPVYALPDGDEVQRRHLQGGRPGWGKTGLRVLLPFAKWRPAVVVDGEPALRLLERAMPVVNAAGASARSLDAAVDGLAEAGSADAFLERAGRAGVFLAPPPALERDVRLTLRKASATPVLPGGLLALEMALHEEQERRALAGELALLESAWREAEEIAAIADRLALPNDPERRG